MSGIFPLPDPADLYNLMILFFYFFNYFTVVQLQLSVFSPRPTTPPHLCTLAFIAGQVCSRDLSFTASEKALYTRCES